MSEIDWDALKSVLREAFEAGFKASAEGFNGEFGAYEDEIEELARDYVSNVVAERRSAEETA